MPAVKLLICLVAVLKSIYDRYLHTTLIKPRRDCAVMQSAFAETNVNAQSAGFKIEFKVWSTITTVL